MITPIRCGVDTLEATFSGEPDFYVMKEVSLKKVAAQGKGSPVPVLLCGEEFFVSPKGMTPWMYVLKNEDMHIRIGAPKGFPPMSIKLLSAGLVSRGALNLWSLAVRVAQEFSLMPMNLTRLDIAVDMQGWTPGYAEMHNVVCPSDFRPVYPNVDKPETFQFGKGATVVRLYNKTKEVEVRKKGWWHNVWRLHDYDPAQAVWRLEVQLRSETLKQLEMRDVGRALDNVYALFCYGLSWCSLRTPTNDSNMRRWPVHRVWSELEAKFAPGVAVGRVRPAVTAMKYDACIARIAGLMASAGAATGLSDYDELCEAVYGDVLRHIHDRREMDFAEFVEEKRCKQIAGE